VAILPSSGNLEEQIAEVDCGADSGKPVHAKFSAAKARSPHRVGRPIERDPVECDDDEWLK
jgi:hypothetical protein